MRVPQFVPSVAGVELARRRSTGHLVIAAAGAAATAIMCLLVGTGWIDGLRGWGVLDSGPHVADALPLRQLAGAGDQPLLRVLAGWIPTGLMAGLLLRSQPIAARAALLGVPFWLLYVVAADFQYALVHNLRAWQIVQTRGPSAAAFVATACLIVGSSLIGARRR